MADTMHADLLTALIAPFADGPAAGADPRDDVTPNSRYFRLRDARADARAEERMADNDPSLQETGARHWKIVRELSVQVLTEGGKDIEIAAWLAESLVRSEGLSGLTAGARILQGLVERFWHDGVYPSLDEDGPEARLAAIAGLSGAGSDGTLLQPLRRMVLLERADGSPVTFWQFEQSREVSTLGDAARKAQRLAAGVLPLDELESLARGTGRAAMETLERETIEAIAAWTALEAALSSVVPDGSAPSMRRLHDVLATLRRITAPFVPAVPLPGAIGADSSSPESSAPDRGAAMIASAVPGPSREALLDDVLRIAAVFRTTEPNSPLSYTLEDAVRRARLPWPELLQEMLPDAAARGAVLSGFGIRVAAP